MDGDFGGMGAAGPGPSEGSETGEGDYGGAFGGMAGITGSDGSASDTNALASLFGLTDLSTSLADFSADADYGFSMPDLGMPNMNDTSLMSFLQDLNKSKPAQALMSFLASKNPAFAAMMSTPAKAAMSSNPASTIANSAINFGLSSMGPIGMGMAALGNMTGLTSGLTSALGNTNAISSADSQQGINEGNSGMLPGLAGLYAGYKGQKEMGNMLGGLQSLYSQDSPYAQMMRQQLQRKDAAGGRRSQYGPREVELQAKLAQMASQQIPAMSQLAQNKALARNAMMQQGIGAFQKMGGLKGLASLFGMGGGGGMYDTAASGALNNMPNFFGMDGMNSFGNLPPDVRFDFFGPPGG